MDAATTPATSPASPPPAAPEAKTSAPADVKTTDTKAATPATPAKSVIGSAENADTKTETGGSPEDFELKFAEGLAPDPQQVDGFKKLAKEAGLKGEQAQKFVDFYQNMQSAYTKAQIETFEKAQNERLESLKADKEFGGPNWDKSVSYAHRAILKFGGAELAQSLDRMGLGNEPTLIKLFARIGKALGEDSLAGSTSAPPRPAKSDQDFVNLLYGKKE